MAQFSKIIGALLCDIIQAQHEANLYASRLGGEYGEGGKTTGFTLPHATLGDIELNLNYGIEDATAECEHYETNYRKLHSFLKDFSFQTAKVAISSVMLAVKATNIADKCEARQVWTLLSGGSSKEYRKLLAFLSRKIYSELVSATELFIDEQGSVRTGPLGTSLCDAVRNDLLHLPDIDALLSGSTDKVRAEMEQNLAGMLSPFVSQLVSEENFANKRIVPSADVIVDAQSLEKLPVECIHSIRLKLSLPDCTQYVEPDNKK